MKSDEKCKNGVIGGLGVTQGRLETIARDEPTALIVLVGDFNGLSDNDVVSRTALTCLVNKPTRGSSCLDRIYVNELCYEQVRTVTSTVKSDHCAVLAYSDAISRTNLNKRRFKQSFRQRTPAQHDSYLQNASKHSIYFCTTDDVQTNFDQMYDYLYMMLNCYYPERETTVTSTDPYFVIPAIKVMLRKKNRLMCAGRVEEAAAIAKRLRSLISKRNSVHLRRYDTRQNVRETWSKV